MSRKKKKPVAKPTMAIPRPEEIAYLKRWQGVKSSPSFWERKDRDVCYEAALESRGGETGGGSTMSNHWGIGKPYPRRRND